MADPRRRRALGAVAAVLVLRPAAAAIVGPPPSTVRVRHRLSGPRLDALEGRRLTALPPDAPLRVDVRRLLGKRYDAFVAGLGDEVPMRRIGTALLGEGAKPRSNGTVASFFVLGADGAMFAVVKGGPFGADIERFGDEALLADWVIRHRYLEFVDLDE